MVETVYYLTLEEMKRSIREARDTPQLRNIFCQYIDEKLVLNARTSLALV